MIGKVLMIKLVITVAIVAYFIHPALPTIGSLLWLWLEVE